MNPERENEKNGFEEDFGLLPHDLSAEQFLLEACCRKDGIDKASEIVEPQDFYSTGGRLLFAKILGYHQAGHGFTISMLENSFAGHPEQEGIKRILDELVPVTSESASHFARIIRELSLRRKLVKFTYRAYRNLYDVSIPAKEIIDRLQTQISRMGERGRDGE